MHLSPLERLWLCETIRLREDQAGPLDDSEINRHVVVGGGDFRQRLERRALLLAERDGQLAGLQHWRQGARLALLLLGVVALLSGAGLAFAALGDGQRPVNVFWALGSLLGLHLLTLFGWALSFVLVGDSGAVLGRLWLWLSGKLARDAQVAQLAPALLLTLQREKLARWALGSLVHGLWLLILLSALLVLLALLATRRYGFVWETTILSDQVFVALTQGLGALPALLGFAVPSEVLIRASGDSALGEAAARQAWSSWLLGVLLVYGLLPRLLLALVCAGQWLRGKARLRLDLGLPGYSLLRERLLPSSERLGVLDPAPPLNAAGSVSGTPSPSDGALLVAVELDPQRAWPPVLPSGVADAGVLDSREQRQRLLEQLARFPAKRLVIACDPRRSPDRGTLALLGELARSATSTRVWLLAPPPNEALDSERLGDWHAALEQLQLAHVDSSPLGWLETGHD
ncbi:DUF2868 domain-containing protein [Pseudomonas sp. LS44]|uniref:DUF2868 domain-containing protein n=1 Tax=Pseudomonas sp. LS44 TaxID=1357074 RepID=UPI00215B5E56|nr:DUF2868 domain-containing protein [Pseudomonas sp. LS44]UVE19829.1 DUF2868 domain-containing protein [Pseudomonas sp. LS44]